LTPENLGGVATSADKDVKNRQLDEFMATLRLTTPDATTLAALLDGTRDYREEFYVDPLRERSPQEFDGKWLAAFARVGSTDWIAIVQERRQTAIEPVQKINAIFYTAGVVAIIVFGVLLGILWYFLNRASSRQ
jgi:hypothetical protein